MRIGKKGQSCYIGKRLSSFSSSVSSSVSAEKGGAGGFYGNKKTALYFTIVLFGINTGWNAE